MSRHALNASFSLLAALCLALAAPACGSSSNDKSDAGEQLEPGGPDNGGSSDADASTSGPENESPDAGPSEPTDAGEDEEEGEGDGAGDEATYTGCDLMEFAPENRSNQGAQSALLNLKASVLGYFQEAVWFEGGEDGIWMIDSVNLSVSGDPIPFPTGTWKLEGNDLGNNSCAICLDLGRANMDEGGVDEIFYPEDVVLDVEAADLVPGGALKFRVSGRFRKDGDASAQSWCVNNLVVDTTIDLFCTDASDCPEDMPVCDYPASGSYPICMAASDE